MFTVHCETIGRTRLLGPRSITSLENTADGVVLYYRCHCGASGFVAGGAHPRSYHGPSTAEVSALAS